MAPLDTLDQIDWATIHHSHLGTCEQFPIYIRALLSDNDESWSYDPYTGSPFSEMWEYCSHQGTLSEVAPVVIPFLVELIQVISNQRKEQLLDMLTSFALSCQFFWDDMSEYALQMYRELFGDEYEMKRNQEDSYTEQTRAVLRRYLPLWQTLLNDESLVLRRSVIPLLTRMGRWNIEVATEINELLANRLLIEPENESRDMITQAINS
jgi:hypothetical protein